MQGGISLFANLPAGASEVADVTPKVLEEKGNEIIDNFLRAIAALFTPSDPLILDLNGDGVKTTSVASGAYFDVDCTGFAELTAWANDEDGVLARDVNNNGWIDNGSELFGDQTLLSDGVTKATSGFQALAELDSNGDNKIDVNDTAFAELGVIKDNELIYLDELGIKEISLNNTSYNQVDENGNMLLSKATYITKDGTTLEIGEFNLNSETYYSIPLEYDESVNTSTTEDLPEVAGHGNVYNLNYAMAADQTGNLKGLVEQFIDDGLNMLSPSERYDKVDEILFKWAAPEEYNVNDNRGEFDAKKLAILEKFMGRPFRGDYDSIVNSEAVPFLDAAYIALKEEIYGRLMVQSHLKEFYDEIFVIKTVNEVDFLEFTLNDAATKIEIKSAIDSEEALLDLKELGRSLKILGLIENAEYDEFFDKMKLLGTDYENTLKAIEKIQINGDDSAELISGSIAAEAISALGGDDTIYSRQGDDLILGGDGNDFIDSCYDNDYVNGGAGNDTLQGGRGNDTIYGEDGDDKIYGEKSGENTDYGDDILYGGTGNDTIYGENENNVIFGDDTIYGGAGNDIIYGDEGSDTLDGGSGNDIYYIDSLDVISDDGLGGVDTVFTDFSYTLGEFIENLTLTGTADINATGNNLDNTLNGNSGANILYWYDWK